MKHIKGHLGPLCDLYFVFFLYWLSQEKKQTGIKVSYISYMPKLVIFTYQFKNLILKNTWSSSFWNMHINHICYQRILHYFFLGKQVTQVKLLSSGLYKKKKSQSPNSLYKLLYKWIEIIFITKINYEFWNTSFSPQYQWIP